MRNLKLLPMVMSALILLTGCGSSGSAQNGSNSGTAATKSDKAKVGESCDNANYLSSDGTLWCQFNGTAQWATRDQATTISNGIFAASPDTSAGHGDVAIGCPDFYKYGYQDGQKVSCEFFINVTNVSNRPWDIAGNFYVEAGGKIYTGRFACSRYYDGACSDSARNPDGSLAGQTINPDGSLAGQTINPGDVVKYGVWSDVPFGALVSGVFLATSASEVHLFEAPFNVSLTK